MLILDADFSEKLKTVLSDPEAMAKITAIASSLGASNASDSAEAPPPINDAETQSAPSDSAMNLLSAFSGGSGAVGNDPRVSLLYSLKPLLREEKRERIDALARALAVASMMKTFRK